MFVQYFLIDQYDQLEAVFPLAFVVKQNTNKKRFKILPCFMIHSASTGYKKCKKLLHFRQFITSVTEKQSLLLSKRQIPVYK